MSKSANCPEATPFPAIGYVRLPQIIGRGGPLPISRTAFLERVKAGVYPQPVRLGPRTVAWRVEDIRRLIDELSAQSAMQ